MPFPLERHNAAAVCVKTKSPGFAGTLSIFVIFLNNTPLLQSRLGFKEVVKIKECVVGLHFSVNNAKDKSILGGVASLHKIFF
jgi:hypothetical protein